jgi:sugar (pentulose or hexulose) kinase
MAHCLGIDLARSAIKAVVVDDTQVVRAQSTQPVQTTRLSDGRVERDPGSGWSAACRIGDRLKREHAGERTPHNDPTARGVLFGASADTDAAAGAQAVLKGVAFSIADGLNSLSKAGTDIAAAALLSTTILANVLNIPLTRYVGADAGSVFGAACLARMALTSEPAESMVAPLAGARSLAAAYRPSVERSVAYIGPGETSFQSAAQQQPNKPALERLLERDAICRVCWQTI